MNRRTKSSRGFTVTEMLVSLAVGTVLMGAAVDIFSRSMSATWVSSQKTEMQQDARAALNIMTKDIRMAGGGLPTGGMALASGTAFSPAYGLDLTGAGHLGATNSSGLNFPTLGGIPYLYGVIPGWQKGVKPTGNPTATDIITVAYVDLNFPLQDYQIQFNDVNGNSVTFTSTNPADPAINNPGVGLQQGDLVLFQAQRIVGGSSTTSYALADITTAAGGGGGPSYTVLFANNDVMKINQNSATANDLKQIVSNVGRTANSTIAKRVWLVTYYLWNEPNPAGGNPIPVLMRQVNARTPVPVAENVTNLQFLYDTYDTLGNLQYEQGDGGQSLGVSPNEIRTIKISHLTFRSQLPGTRSAYVATKGYQSYDLQSTLSARNLSFSDRYH